MRDRKKREAEGSEKEEKNGKWRGEMRFAVSFINHTERDLTAL